MISAILLGFLGGGIYAIGRGIVKGLRAPAKPKQKADREHTNFTR